MNRERRIVRLNHRIGNLRRRKHRESQHHPIRVLLSDLRNQERTHTRPGSTAERMADLKPLQAVTVLRLLPDHIEHRVDELGALGVVALGPVVSGAGLAEHEVVGSEDLAVRAGSDAVHGSGLEIHEDSARDEAAAARFVVVDIDALELELVVALVPAGGVDAVFGADHFPELCSDLVTALASLNVKDFSHFSHSEKLTLSLTVGLGLGLGLEMRREGFVGVVI